MRYLINFRVLMFFFIHTYVWILKFFVCLFRVDGWMWVCNVHVNLYVNKYSFYRLSVCINTHNQGQIKSLKWNTLLLFETRTPRTQTKRESDRERKNTERNVKIAPDELCLLGDGWFWILCRHYYTHSHHLPPVKNSHTIVVAWHRFFFQFGWCCCCCFVRLLFLWFVFYLSFSFWFIRCCCCCCFVFHLFS